MKRTKEETGKNKKRERGKGAMLTSRELPTKPTDASPQHHRLPNLGCLPYYPNDGGETWFKSKTSAAWNEVI